MHFKTWLRAATALAPIVSFSGCGEGPAKISSPPTAAGPAGPGPGSGPTLTVASVVPFVWSPTDGMKEIPLPDAKTIYPGAKWDYIGKATAVNNKGVVVGCIGWPTPDSHAFVWSPSSGFVDIQPPLDGQTCATAINDMGVVAGSANFWGRTGFVWKPGGNVQFLPVYSGETIVNGINEAGEVVGSITPFNSAQAELAFTWSADGGLRLLPSTSGGRFARAFDINDVGQVVGLDSRVSNSGVVGAAPVLWKLSTGARSELTGLLDNACTEQVENGIQGDCAAVAVSINNSGEIAGTIGGRAFRWDPQAGLTMLQLPDDRKSTAAAINAFGDIAGTAMTRTGKNRTAFVWKRSGEVINLGSLPGKTSTDATGINDAGQVVGFSQ